MPSAANKLEKEKESLTTTTSASIIPTNTNTNPIITNVNNNDNNNASNQNNSTPLRQALIIIEHKIRNLEKRKTKLESYRAIQSSGKELSNDQKAAVAKYDEVAQSLEFARDLSKQMTQLAISSEKDEKKKARKESALRTQSETNKIRETLTIQNVLSSMCNNQVREDFLNGLNGACKLDENDLNILERFYIDTQVKRPDNSEEQQFQIIAQKAAEHLSFTIDGRQKPYGETTYEYVKQILTKIQDCNYLENTMQNDVDGASENEEITDADTNTDNVEVDIETPVEDMEEPVQMQLKVESHAQQMISQIVSAPQPHELPAAPSAAAVPAPAFPQHPHTIDSRQLEPQQQQQIPIQNQLQPQTGATVQPLVAGQPTGSPANMHFPPTTVRAVEQAYFKQHQYIQQMRPLAEVISGGSFFFLQDSELDSPDMIGLPVGIPGYPALQQAQQTGQVPPIPQTGQQGSVEITNSPQPPQQQIPPGLQQQQQPQVMPAQQQKTPLPQQQIVGGQAIPTQTFTNQTINHQSFPPIVPTQHTVQQQQPQSHAIFSPSINNNNQIPQGTQQQVTQPPQVVILQNTNDLKSQNSTTQQQQPPPPAVFSNMPPNMMPPHNHHSMHPSAGSGSLHTSGSSGNIISSQMTDAQAAAAAAMVLQQQQQQQKLLGASNNTQSIVGISSNSVQQLSGFNSSSNNNQNFNANNNSSGYNNTSTASFNNSGNNSSNKFQGISQNTVQQQQKQQQQQQPQQQQQQQPISGLAPNNLSSIIQQSKEKYDCLLEKPQNLDLKKIDRTQSKDISEWDTTSEKIRHRGEHHHHQSKHLNNHANSQTETNQWSNDMHSNSQQQPPPQTNNSANKNDWTFDSSESNHWNSDSAYNRNRSQFNRSGRNDRTGTSSGIERNNSDRIRPSNTGPPSNGSFRRSAYNSNGGPPPTSQSNPQNSGNRNGNSFFRNNENYYQNGGGNSGSSYNKDTRGGYNGGGGDRYRSGNSGSRGPQNSLPPRMANNPKGNAAGVRPSPANRPTAGGYGARRQQDVGIVDI